MVDKIKVENLSCFYSGKQVLKNLNLTVKKNEILSIIGPSNSGKTSFPDVETFTHHPCSRGST